MLYLFTVKHFSAIHILQKPHFTFFKSEKLCWVGIRFFFEQSTNTYQNLCATNTLFRVHNNKALSIFK